MTAPFFGPNVWEGILIPTIGGGFAPHHQIVQIKLTFKEGGAFDLHTTFERIKEQVVQAAEITRESGNTGVNRNGPIDVDLEQLPAYEEVGNERWMQQPPPPIQTSVQHIQRPTPISPNGIAHPPQLADEPVQQASRAAPTTNEPYFPPREPPPGYEEAQSSSVADNLERRLQQQE